MYTKISFKSKLSFQRIFACFNNFSVLTPILFLIIFLFNSCSTAAAAQTVTDGKDDLEVEIQSDKTTFFEGEPIDIFVNVTNNTDNLITFSLPTIFLYDCVVDSLYKEHYEGHGKFELLPHQKFSYYLDVTHHFIPSRIDFAKQILQPGEYDYHIAYHMHVSNKIHIKVIALPDSLKSEFLELKNCSDIENARLLYERHKGSFFKQRFFSRYLRYPANLEEIMGLKANQYEDYILKYPDNVEAWFFLRNMIYKMSDNPGLVERIITQLQKQRPDCKLLIVLRNQPEHITNKIKHILN